MEEQEYIDATDLAKVRMALTNISECMCIDDPNKTRRLSVLGNIKLMEADLYNKIKVNN